jgi:hypothetical protein
MSGDTFLYIYSKYSSSCNEILPIVHQIAPSTGLIAIDADNIKMRNYLLSLKIFNSVPCIILSYPNENRMEIYEGNDVIMFLNKILSMLGKPSVEVQLNKVSQLPNLPKANIPSMRVTSSASTVTSTKPKSENGKTMLSFDSKPVSNVPKGKTPIAVRIDDPFEEHRELEKLANTDPSDMKNVYQDRMMNSNLNIKKGEGHENMKSSITSIGEDSKTELSRNSNFTPLDDDDYNSSDNSLIIQPTKVDYNDLVGPNGPPQNKELEAKQDRIKNAAAAMMSEREELDSVFSKKKGGSG